MRILFTVDQGYLPQRTGGALESTDALCRALLQHGHQVAALAELISTGFLGLSYRFKRRLGVQLPRDQANGYPTYRDWSPAAQVGRVCESFRPDAAIVKSGDDPEMAEALANHGVPTVVYLRDMAFDRDDWRKPSGERITFIANTTDGAERFAARFGRRPPVIHSLIEPERYRVHSARKTVTFINPILEKGLNVALHLAKERPDIAFQIVESWPLSPAQRATVTEAVRFLKNVTFRDWTRDVRKIYATTRILIVPSQMAEAQARCVAEVQLNGIPVIASEIGGLPESVGPGGVLVAPADLAGWRRALDELWDRPDRYAQLSAQALAQARRPELQADHIVSALLRLIQDHIGRR